MTNKYCEYEGCKLEAAKDNIDKMLDLQENHDDFIRMLIRDNPEVHPSCIKKYLAEKPKSYKIIDYCPETKQFLLLEGMK